MLVSVVEVENGVPATAVSCLCRDSASDVQLWPLHFDIVFHLYETRIGVVASLNLCPWGPQAELCISVSPLALTEQVQWSRDSDTTMGPKPSPALPRPAPGCLSSTAVSLVPGGNPSSVRHQSVWWILGKEVGESRFHFKMT